MEYAHRSQPLGLSRRKDRLAQGPVGLCSLTDLYGVSVREKERASKLSPKNLVGLVFWRTSIFHAIRIRSSVDAVKVECGIIFTTRPRLHGCMPLCLDSNIDARGCESN